MSPTLLVTTLVGWYANAILIVFFGFLCIGTRFYTVC